MENKEFKKLFNDVAKSHDFESAFGGWIKESSDCIVVLELQKSNFGNYYQLNIKIYVQGVFGRHYSKGKDLVKKSIGNIDRGEPKEYEEFLALDSSLNDVIRRKGIESLFKDFLGPFVNKALSRTGISELAERGEIFLLPAVKKELGL